MLMYHPAFDANHCLYRMVAIMHGVKCSIPWDLLRIIDYYYLFPSELKKISPWPSEMREYKSTAKSIPSPFEEITSPSRIFFDLQEFQKTAILELITKGIISKEKFEAKEVELIPDSIPGGFLERLSEDRFITSEIFDALVTGLPRVEIQGASGLKKRSKLMEFIYDPKQ